jgi:hypothetical protein
MSLRRCSPWSTYRTLKIFRPLGYTRTPNPRTPAVPILRPKFPRPRLQCVELRDVEEDQVRALGAPAARFAVPAAACSIELMQPPPVVAGEPPDDSVAIPWLSRSEPRGILCAVVEHADSRLDRFNIGRHGPRRTPRNVLKRPGTEATFQQRLDGIHEVTGSNPVSSTNSSNKLA